MGQLVEWPEVITEGKTIEECREVLRDALSAGDDASIQAAGQGNPPWGGLLGAGTCRGIACRLSVENW